VLRRNVSSGVAADDEGRRRSERVDSVKKTHATRGLDPRGEEMEEGAVKRLIHSSTSGAKDNPVGRQSTCLRSRACEGP
jgi:hypothetical protein